MIRTPEAKYLKHAGNEMDVKVTIRIVDGFPMIYIRDYEFFGFQQALKCLQRIAADEVIREEALSEEN